MRILVVNDDSITSPFLKELVRILVDLKEEVMVVAPFVEQSGKSHALTLRRGMILKEYPEMFEGVKTYSLDGTPADCTKFAYKHLKYDFDLVVSGCNNGLNMGDDIMYSGTVAGASEAAFLGKKGMAVSVKVNDMEALTKNFKEVFEKVIQSKIYKKAQILNINIPSKIKGIKITHQGCNIFDTQFVLRDDGYLATGHSMYGMIPNKETCDLVAFYDDYVSVTPLTIDRTDYETYNEVIK